jgi:ABC-2 type transport system permease protein
MHDQRRPLIGWSIGVVALVLLVAALWPSIRQMPELNELLAGYPEYMRRLFNLEEFGTGTGFLNAELFGSLIPLLMIVYGVGRGARAVAGEEESGTLDILLLTPMTMGRLIVQQAAALLTGLAVLGSVLYATVLIASGVFDLGVGAGDLAAASLAVVLLGFEFGCLALAVGAATGRRGVAIGVGSAAAIAAYLLYAAGELADAVRPWQAWSPFEQALSGGPIGGGVSPAYLSMPIAAAAFLLVAMPLAGRRDIAVAH